MEYIFLKSGVYITPELMTLISRSVSDIEKKVYTHVTYVNDKEIVLVRDSDGIFTVRDTDKYSQNFIKIVEDSINSHINTKGFRVDNVETIMEVYHTRFNPGFPSKFFENPNVWMVYMIDPVKRLIVGYYNGYVSYDVNGRKYNHQSSILIRPEYTGKKLCAPFAEFVYSSVISNFDILYFNIHIVSNTPYFACKCYVSAAKKLGLRAYISSFADNTFHEVYDREDCSVYNLDITSKLIITKDLDIDDVMVGSYSDEW